MNSADERTSTLFPIGRFSLLSRLTVRALRLYDREGLLTPAWVDPQTSYRYYGTDQIAHAEHIRLLREIDLPLEDVRAALADPARLPALLAAHAERLRDRVRDSERAFALLTRIQEGTSLMNTTDTIDVTIDIRDTPPVIGACLTERTDLVRMSETLGRLFPTIGQFLRGAGLEGGTDFAVYPDEEFDPDNVTVVAGISLAEPVPDNELGITHGTYGGGRTVVTTLKGPYADGDDLRVVKAWKQAWSWVTEHGHRPSAPAYEFYVVGFAESNDPSTFVTELRIPIG